MGLILDDSGGAFINGNFVRGVALHVINITIKEVEWSLPFDATKGGGWCVGDQSMSFTLKLFQYGINTTMTIEMSISTWAPEIAHVVFDCGGGRVSSGVDGLGGRVGYRRVVGLQWCLRIHQVRICLLDAGHWAGG